MKNRFVLFAAIALLVLAVVGCGWLNPFGKSSSSSKGDDAKTGESSTSDSAIESVIVEKTGVPECDELSAYFSKLVSSKDEGYVAKATREFIINRYREAIRESIEKNKENPEKLAKLCKEYQTQLETFKKDEDAKKEEK
jgi:hypothetical protein